MRQERLAGLERLAAVTDLLQRMRLQAPRGGVWEAADMQWWWRRPRPSDDLALPVWFDDAGQPLAAALLTAWPDAWWLDILRRPDAAASLPIDVVAAPAWAQIDGLADAPVLEALVAAEDGDLRDWYVRRGFVAINEVWSGWMAATERPPVAPLPTGYRLVDRAVRGVAVAPAHPMVARSGAQVEERLRQTRIYDPQLDLAVLGPGGDVVGYALFWNDPLTGVGMVEPVRVEDEHAGRGIGYAMISAGLERLASAGASRLKIGWESARAGELYTRLGFTDVETLVTYRRTPPLRTAATPGS